MCCVFESFAKRETPAKIESEDASSPSLFHTKYIPTDYEKAARVYKSIVAKISLSARELIENAFLTFRPEKELMVLKFLQLGYKTGSKVMNHITEESVDFLLKIVHHLTFEAMRFRQFVRFSICDGVLVAEIEPKNFVLPLIMEHFCERYADDSFLIYDKTHKQALVYNKGRSDIIYLDEWQMPEIDDDEYKYRVLWKQFFETVAIKERINPRCQRNFMPIWYRAHMTEFMKVDEERLARIRLDEKVQKTLAETIPQQKT